MSSEPETEGAPPVPNVWRLGWLLFMQPIALHRMYQAWGVGGDPSLLRLRRLARAGNPVIRALLKKYALLLLVVMPLTVALAASALSLLGITVQLPAVALAVGCGIVVGVGRGVMIGVAGGVAAGVAGGVVFGLTGGVDFGPSSGVSGIILKFAIAFGVVGGVVSDVVGSAVGGVVRGVVTNMAIGAMFSVVFSVGWGMAVGVTMGMAYGRVPLWLALPSQVGCSRMVADERSPRTTGSDVRPV